MSSKLIILIIVLPLFISPVQVSSLQRIHKPPVVIDTLSNDLTLNASQQWHTQEIGVFQAGPEYRHIIHIILEDNLTRIFGETSIYRVFLNFSILDFIYPPYKFLELSLEKDTSRLLTIDFNATSSFKVFAKLSILSGNSKNSSVDLNLSIETILIKDYSFNLEENDYLINSTSFPHIFQSQQGFLGYEFEPAYVFLQNFLTRKYKNYQIQMKIYVKILTNEADGTIRIELLGEKQTISLSGNVSLIFEFKVDIKRTLEMSIWTDAGDIKFEFSNITIYVPKELKQDSLDFPKLPLAGPVIGSGLMILSVMITNIFHSVRTLEEEDVW